MTKSIFTALALSFALSCSSAQPPQKREPLESQPQTPAQTQTQPQNQTPLAQPAPVVTSVPTPPRTNPYTLDANRSLVQFYMNASLMNVTGVFRKFSITEVTQPGDITSIRGKILIETASVFTREKKRDDHLRADDFFWSEKYPNAVITVKSIVPAAQKDTYNVTISLQIRDKSRDFTVPTVITQSNEGIIANGQFSVDRTFYDLKGEYMANKIMNDEADITFRFVLIRN